MEWDKLFKVPVCRDKVVYFYGQEEVFYSGVQKRLQKSERRLKRVLANFRAMLTTSKKKDFFLLLNVLLNNLIALCSENLINYTARSKKKDKRFLKKIIYLDSIGVEVFSYQFPIC
uniref:Uncharacterized protein n=1 Tax=Cacopsylla melanoneura TaxID=428564 RepID=A0A8D8W774_9HEMI